MTVDSHKEAEDNFIKRKLLTELPGIGVFIDDLDWGASVKFNKNNGDTLSFNSVELLTSDDDMGLHWLFNMCVPVTPTDDFEDLHLEKLFLEDHFNEDPVDQEELVSRIAQKKRNKLYGIFKEEGLRLTGSPKRKRTPEEDEAKKCRRMSYAGDASPALRNPTGGNRNRTKSLATGRAARKRPGKSFIIVDANQPLLTDIWSIKKNGDEI